MHKRLKVCSVAAPASEVCIAFLCLFSAYLCIQCFFGDTLGQWKKRLPWIRSRRPLSSRLTQRCRRRKRQLKLRTYCSATWGANEGPPAITPCQEEPKENAPAPEIGQLITLTEDLQVVRFTNGTIHLKRAERNRKLSPPLCSRLWVQSIRSQANAPAPSAMSGFTGLASTNRGSAPDTDTDPIEWGDMDPNFRQALQDSPELLKAYNTVRNPKEGS